MLPIAFLTYCPWPFEIHVVYENVKVFCSGREFATSRSIEHFASPQNDYHGGPVRKRGNRIKCFCKGQKPEFHEQCPPADFQGNPNDCRAGRNPDGSFATNLDFTPIIWEPTMGIGNDQFHLDTEWVVPWGGPSDGAGATVGLSRDALGFRHHCHSQRDPDDVGGAPSPEAVG